MSSVYDGPESEVEATGLTPTYDNSSPSGLTIRL